MAAPTANTMAAVVVAVVRSASKKRRFDAAPSIVQMSNGVTRLTIKKALMSATAGITVMIMMVAPADT